MARASLPTHVFAIAALAMVACRGSEARVRAARQSVSTKGAPPADATVSVHSFFAPPEPSGSMRVKLVPTEAVTAGTAQLVTFGVPFARKSIRVADVGRIRVTVDGAEIPAHVDALTPWRHATDPGEDGKYLRVARIQIRHAFSSPVASREVEVEWGLAARTRDVPTFTRVRDGWHRVTSGTFVAADGVDEPNVYALLPKERLSHGLLKPMPMLPFDPEVLEARDNPAAMDATEHYPAFREQQFASKNFFYTAIAEDAATVSPANRCPYKTHFEPWLYDRPAAFYDVYLRSGYLKPLREAVRASVYYVGKLYPPGTSPDAAVGAFRLKNPDPAGYIGANGIMYSYAESLAYTHWLVGDDDAANAIKWVAKGQEDATDEPWKWSPTASGWTERHNAFRLLAHAIAYEVFGDVAYKPGGVSYKALLNTGADNLVWHQNGADGAIPSSKVDGGLWKYGRQQGDGPESSFVASPWMSAIIVDAMVRVYAVSQRDDVARFLVRMGTFLKAATKRQRDEEYESEKELRKVDYVTLIDGSTYGPDGATGDHALEVAASLATAYAFSRITGTPEPSLKAHAAELYETYDYSVNYWTRPAAPASGSSAYRLSVGSCRKYNWEHRPSASLSWALSE